MLYKFGDISKETVSKVLCKLKKKKKICKLIKLNRQYSNCIANRIDVNDDY